MIFLKHITEVIRMKKILGIFLAGAMVLSLTACGDKTSSSASASFEFNETPIVVTTDDGSDASVDAGEGEKTDKDDKDVIPANSYRSELTNEWISQEIETQRPVAVMIDNESTALPHYGTSDADIVYEMMNSTANGRITRLMCIFKDWRNIDVIGNIRSTRSTNAIIFPEYNAILVHDGGPFYIKDWLANPKFPNSYDHLSGGFARIDRGKGGTYEEYATKDDYNGVGEYSGKSYDGLATRIKAAKFDTEYNKYYMGKHFNFSDDELSLANEKGAEKAEKIELPYPHNSTKLTYNKDTETYDYSEYGQEYVDGAYTDGRGMSFKNVIIQTADFVQFDENGYMCFYAIGSGTGYFITDGYAIPIKWEKPDQDELTKFYRKDNGEEITLNTGKTYITICPTDSASKIVIK